MRNYNTANVQIKIFDERIFVYETNIIRITKIGSTASVVVDGYTYHFYTNEIIIDYSDVIASRASDSGNVVVDGVTISYVRFFGVSPDANVILPPTKLIIPKTLPGIDTNFALPFYNAEGLANLIGIIGGNRTTLLSHSLGVFSDSYIVNIQNYDALEVVVGSHCESAIRYKINKINNYKIYSRDIGGGIAQSYYPIAIERGECGVNYLLMNWLGRNGLYKSYVFEVVSATRSADIAVELEDIAYKNSVIMNKKMGINLDLIARDICGGDIEYLSDIITSNSVSAYDVTEGLLGVGGWVSVGVTTKNVNYSQERGDFKITIATKKYY